MLDFSGIQFRGSFRDYQQTVLNNTGHHLRDGKVHIVAAPGSGKTVLGLELIRSFNQPTLVLSPSVTIRQQWGDRFEERFLPEGAALDSYVSFDLKEPRALTSVTYQALHAASCKQTISESLDLGEDESAGEDASGGEGGNPTNHGNPASSTNETSPSSTHEDFSNYDLIASMKQAGVKVLCLDEAHHLRSEWHKALTAFIKAMAKAWGHELTIIALTATPPYDASKAEWDRYITLCGPIDEEIFVPELVMKKTLCPHQDYVYFSYPITSERELLKEYRLRAEACLEEIDSSRLLERILLSSPVIQNLTDHLDIVLKNENEFFALFSMAVHCKIELPRELQKLMKTRNVYRRPESWRKSFRAFEAALQFVIGNPDIFTAAHSEELYKLVARYGLIERRQVRLLSDDRLKRLLVASMGKLQGITQIVHTEAAALGGSLRMLILTDYIKKEMLPVVGSEAKLSTMGAVPIFEAVRRAVGEGCLLALLTGTLVIIPEASREGIAAIAHRRGVPATFKPLANVAYLQVDFSGSNKHKVAVLTEAFQQGLINILVGTKSLLGEGWDSPCINALILASFVGSFMLSNQMRGRAIRIDPQVPTKTANIWHLATVEPVFDADTPFMTKLGYGGLEHTRELDGDDWETLVRRFDCFMGPAYARAAIESGVERLDAIEPPFDQAGIARINAEMQRRARDRSAMAQAWEDALPAGFYPVVEESSEYTPPRLPTRFVFANLVPMILLLLIEVIIANAFTAVLVSQSLQGSARFVVAAIALAFVLCAPLLMRAALRCSRLLSPRRRVAALARAVLAALGETGHIRSLGAKTHVKSDPMGAHIVFGLRQATIHEQTLFAEAMREILSPIENPKYLLLRRRAFGYDYLQSYACPTLLATNKQDAELLCKNLSQLLGAHRLVLTYNAQGRELLWKCSNRSFINLTREIYKKLAVFARR